MIFKKNGNLPKLWTFWKKIVVSDRISNLKSQPNPWCPSPCIGPAMRIGRESGCLPYAGFLIVQLIKVQYIRVPFNTIRDWSQVMSAKF